MEKFLLLRRVLIIALLAFPLSLLFPCYFQLTQDILGYFVFAEENHLTLKESISIALRDNPSIMIAREKIEEARAEKGKALSNFFPKFYTLSSYTRLDEKTTIDIELPDIQGFPSVPSAVLTDDEIYDYNLGFTQPLFTGGRFTSLYQLQKENLQAKVNFLEKVKNDLIFEVKKSYFKVLEAEKLRRVAEEAVNQVEAHLGVVKSFFEEGLSPEVEVLRAKVALANAHQNLINAENAVKLAKSYFNSLLNRDMDREVNLVDIMSFEEFNIDLSSSVERAFSNRPEIKGMKNRLKMLEKRVKMAQSNFFPQVTLIGNWDRKKGAEVPIDEWEESWSAIISVSMDIWDWGENRNEARKAKAQLKQLQNSLCLLKNKIELEVRRAYLSLLASRGKIKLQQEAVKEAEKNFKDTSLRFREGMAATTDVLDAQILLTGAQTNYYQALYNHNIATAAFERATGVEIPFY